MNSLFDLCFICVILTKSVILSSEMANDQRRNEDMFWKIFHQRNCSCIRCM